MAQWFTLSVGAISARQGSEGALGHARSFYLLSEAARVVGST